MKAVVFCGCLLFWTTVAGAQWQNGTSGAIYYSGGNVGIATGTPAASLDVNGNVRVSAANAQFRTTSSLAFRDVTTNMRSVVRIMPNGAISAIPSALEFFGTDYIADAVNWERLSFRAKGSGDDAYLIFTDAGGTGLVRPIRITTGANQGLLIDSQGRVGIGNAAPQYALDVHGTINADEVISATYGQDVAEWVAADEELAPGTVVVLDPSRSNHVMPSRVPYDTSVAGVISEKPGLVLGRPGAEKAKVATLGRVRVHVDASKRPVRIGDLLVTSDKAGTAMVSEAVEIGGVRMHRPGTLIGKALEPLAAGEGDVLALLSLQ